VTIDRGEHWMALTANMPFQPINDLLVHPRDNDLVLATHGRGIWILDQVNVLQELSSNVLDENAFLFSVEPATMIRYASELGHTGDLFYTGANPPAGAIIDYYLRTPHPGDDVDLSLYDAQGQQIVALQPDTTAGLHRIVWDLRHPSLPPPLSDDNDEDLPRRRSGPDGPFVAAGRYTARLTVGEETRETSVLVREDPRITLPVEDRLHWTQCLLEITALYRAVHDDAGVVAPVHAALDRLEKEGVEVDLSTRAEINETHRLYTELASRILTLYRQVKGWTGRMTQDQEAQLTYYRDVHRRLRSRKQALTNDLVPRLNEALPVDRRISMEP
jgi:hypothetical protein